MDLTFFFSDCLHSLVFKFLLSGTNRVFWWLWYIWAMIKHNWLSDECPVNSFCILILLTKFCWLLVGDTHNLKFHYNLIKQSTSVAPWIISHALERWLDAPQHTESALGKRKDYQGKTNPWHNVPCTWPYPNPQDSSPPILIICWELHCSFWRFWPFFSFTVLF